MITAQEKKKSCLLSAHIPGGGGCHRQSPFIKSNFFFNLLRGYLMKSTSMKH